ncbi:MAG: hypothetical protein IJ861_05255 [Clostridia bacterium]|nr:hypothetical protein [Clostridia bacterium]
MNKLMKAEWYRLTHSGNLKKWGILLFFAVMLMPFLLHLGRYDKDLFTNIIECDITQLYVMLMTICPVIVGVFVGMAYLNKTAYYEVMAGNSPADIILSKVFVDGMIVWLIVQVSSSIYYIYVVLANGTGGIEQFGMRYLLISITLLHLCLSGVLITTAFRDMAGAVIAFIRFVMVDASIVTVITAMNENNMDYNHGLVNIFITMKFTNIIYNDIDTSLILCVIIPFVAEILFWFAISYFTMKKKRYK